MRRILFGFGMAWLAASASAFDLSPHELNVYLSRGASPQNFHGHSLFWTIHFEVTGDSKFVGRWIPNAEVGTSIAYSDIKQARSWFGYRYGDPDDRVRAVSSYFFVRKPWRAAYIELGTGPMWSNRRVPAATSRLNFDSQLGLGAHLFPNSRVPLRIGYRFSHISNGGFTGRNPGLNVHSIMVGARVLEFRRNGRQHP
jgi:hypothetical protein